MDTTETANTVQGERDSDAASQPGTFPSWILRLSKEWAQDTYRPHAVSAS
jgi:hypothetical protein